MNGSISDAARALALRIEEHGGGRFFLTLESTQRVATALRLYADIVSELRDDDLMFKVECWENGSVSEVLARVSLLPVAVAAFEAAKEYRAGFRLTVRKQSHVIREHVPYDGVSNSR